MGRRFYGFLLFASTGSLAWCATSAHAQQCSSARKLISDLRLDGDLRDRVTAQIAAFARPSIAYTSEGAQVPPDSPRFEQFAAANGFEWRLPEITADQVAPIAIAGGKLFAQDRNNNVLVSLDGANFAVTGRFPYTVYVGAAYGTPEGALLISTGSAYDPDSPRGVWRSEDSGYTFTKVLDFRVGTPSAWSWAALGSSIFVSEYGKKTLDGGGNARQIYRSEDDGRTWRLVYDEPPMERRHPHLLLADPWGACVYSFWGDSDEQVIRTCDGGESWQWIHDYYQPIGGIARPEGLYTGHEGIGVPGVQRYDRATGRSAHVWRPWFYVDNGNERIKTMLEHNGVIYVPNSMGRQEMWASVDGDHWAFLHGPFHAGDDIGIEKLVGVYGGWIHAYYNLGNSSPHTRAYLRVRPGRVTTIGGIRIEAPAENLLETEQSASAESGLQGWNTININTILTWDTSMSFDGRASVRVDAPNSRPTVLCPTLSRPVPVGTLLQARIQMIGDERTLLVTLFDEVSGQAGNALSASPFDVWTPARCSMVVQNQENRVRLKVDRNQTIYYPRPLKFWIDALQVTAGQTGSTWVPAGTPRAGDVLRYAVPFGGEWTDFVTVNPDFNSIEGDDRKRTLKAWVVDSENYAGLVFDPADRLLKLIEVADGQAAVLCSAGPVEIQPGWVHRIAVRSSSTGCGFRVRVGTAIDYEAGGPPLSIQPREVWIGSSPLGDDQAPGVYALSRAFTGVLTPDEIECEFSFFCDAGDYDCSARVDLHDWAQCVTCATEPDGPDVLARCATFDFDGDQDVDLADFAAFMNRFSRTP